MKTIILKGGEVGTITRRYPTFVLVELRNRPKVKRPRGMFYEKRIIRLEQQK